MKGIYLTDVVEVPAEVKAEPTKTLTNEEKVKQLLKKITNKTYNGTGSRYPAHYE